MEPASRTTSKLCQVNKPHRSIAGHDQISSKSVSTKGQGGNKVMTKAASLLVSQKPYQQPDEDGQIISSKQAVNKSSSQVWDCGSSLYDSFELNSFNRQLDSAIKASSRILSMPHLPEPLPAMTITNSSHQLVYSKKVGNISKSMKNALRSVFGWSSSTIVVNNNTTISPLIKANSTRETTHTRDSFQVYNESNSMRVLTTIPELQEIDGHHAKFSMEDQPPRAFTTKVSRNANMGKLQAGYLFPEIAKKRNAHMLKDTEAKVISLGIGDTTEPIPEVITTAMANICTVLD